VEWARLWEERANHRWVSPVLRIHQLFQERLRELLNSARLKPAFHLGKVGQADLHPSLPLHKEPQASDPLHKEPQASDPLNPAFQLDLQVKVRLAISAKADPRNWARLTCSLVL